MRRGRHPEDAGSRGTGDLNAKRGVDEAVLKKEIASTKTLGYAVVDGTVIPGMSAVAVPIRGEDQRPVGSITLAAITLRLLPPRREKMVKMLFDEAKEIERSL